MIPTAHLPLPATVPLLNGIEKQKSCTHCCCSPTRQKHRSRSQLRTQRRHLQCSGPDGGQPQRKGGSLLDDVRLYFRTFNEKLKFREEDSSLVSPLTPKPPIDYLVDKEIDPSTPQASNSIVEHEIIEEDIVLLDEVVPTDKVEIEEYAKSWSWQLSNSSQKNEQTPSSPQDNQTFRRRITFSTKNAVDLRQVELLCESVGWPRRPFKKLRIALANSYLLASLTATGYYRDELGHENQVGESVLVGLARATSDHAFNATIWDVAVLPSLQGSGLGKALVEYSTRTLLRRGITNITLFSDAPVVSFYRKMGFQPDPDGIKGMFWYPRF